MFVFISFFPLPQFLYDVSYYGTAIFTPNILQKIFGKNDEPRDVCWQSLAVSSLGNGRSRAKERRDMKVHVPVALMMEGNETRSHCKRT
jgi:hypothetical protein